MRKVLGLICLIAGIIIAVATLKNQEGADKGKAVTRGSPPIALIGIGLRLLLTSGGESVTFSLPKRTGASSGVKMSAGNTSLRGAQDTLASNPAKLRLNFFHWLSAHPAMTGFYIALPSVGLLMLLIKWQIGLVLLIVAGVVFLRTWRELRQKFFQGDVCPGVVLSAQSGLVAVLADLRAATNISRPAIKILKQPLHKISAYELQDGMRVASVSQYLGDVRETAWKDFVPEVIPCVFHDPAENQRVLDSVPEEQWQALDKYLAQIPEARPGLYRMWGENLVADVGASVPWLQRKSVRIGLIAFACVSGLIILLQATVWWNERSRERRAQSSAGQNPSAVPPPVSTDPYVGRQHRNPFDAPDMKPALPSYQPGQKVFVRWGGSWIPGRIVEPIGIGMSYRVQLEDARYTHPMGLSTNMIRPQ